MSGSVVTPLKHCKVNPLFLLLMMSAVALSASTPPVTLPRGFLEQLPMLLEMPEKDYQVLLEAAERETTEPKEQGANSPDSKIKNRQGNRGDL